jgi:endonuclease/exonuclease/phosphatase (EEP) superfamily protein YafD
MIRRLLAAAVTIALAIVLLIAVWPQLFRLEWSAVVAQVVSLRGAAVAVAAVAVVLLAIFGAAFAPARRLTGSLALVLVVFCVASLAVLGTRGIGGGDFAKKTENDITVLSWNTLGDAPGPAAIARLALSSGADVVTLPETTEETGVDVATLMKASGSPMWVNTIAFDQVSKARSTTLLISPRLGAYTVQSSFGNTSTLPTVVATPDDGTGPIIVAVHSVAPVEGEMENWRTDLGWLSQLCTGKDIIMAGDFNSTLDHWGRLAAGPGSALGECADAGATTHNAAVGTWPTRVPALLASPIDHVLSSPGWTASGMRVVQDLDDAGSDHRAIVVQLSRAG